MAQAATCERRDNVLSRLDERAPTSFYWQLTVLATLGRRDLVRGHPGCRGAAVRPDPDRVGDRRVLPGERGKLGLAAGPWPRRRPGSDRAGAADAHAGIAPVALVATTVAGVEVTASMTAVNVAATYLGFRWIDKFGRKMLAIGGYAGMILFALVAVLGLAMLSGTARMVVIMVGLDFFIASFAVGVGGVGWTLQAGHITPKMNAVGVKRRCVSSTALTAFSIGFMVSPSSSCLLPRCPDARRRNAPRCRSRAARRQRCQRRHV
jgi:Sugar (and other) transporter